jgi:hypothetical protein
MLEPKKPVDDGTGDNDAAQRKESTHQVDNKDMNLEEGDGATEPDAPAA